MTFVAVLFAITSTLVALAYPDMQTSSLTAFLASASPGLATYFRVINCLVSFAVACTFPLQFAPAALIVEQFYPQPSSPTVAILYHVVGRLVMVGCCAGLVCAVPSLELLISLMGGLTNTALAALPCLLHAFHVLQLRRVDQTSNAGRRGDGYNSECGSGGGVGVGSSGLGAAEALYHDGCAARGREGSGMESDSLAWLVLDAMIITFCAVVMTLSTVQTLEQAFAGGGSNMTAAR